MLTENITAPTQQMLSSLYNKYRSDVGDQRQALENIPTAMPDAVLGQNLAAAAGGGNLEQTKTELIRRGIQPGSAQWNQEVANAMRSNATNIGNAYAQTQIANANMAQEAAKAKATGYGDIAKTTAGVVAQQGQTFADIEKANADNALTSYWSDQNQKWNQQTFTQMQTMFNSMQTAINAMLQKMGGK